MHAVKEGRTVYDNLIKAILFILPTNDGEALIILAAILFGFHQLPLTPVQILWVNMVTAITLALSLAFESPEQNVMQRPPRNAYESMLTPHLIWRVMFVSVILMSGTFGLFLWEMDQGASIEHSRTVAVNTLIMFEIFYLFNSRYITARFYLPSAHAIFIWDYSNRLLYMVTHSDCLLLCIISRRIGEVFCTVNEVK